MTKPITRPAATIILVRDLPQGPPLLFMMRRAQTMGFAAGAMVFPGGKVDQQDAAIAADPALAPGFAALAEHDAIARVAAIRETYEEAGVLLTRGPALAGHVEDSIRADIVAGRIGFADFLREIGHVLDAHMLTPWARWMPPAHVTHVRFDTHFYLARMPEDARADHDGYESTHSHWVSAAEALALFEAGQGDLIFPTRRNLERLALCDSYDAMVAHAARWPVRLIEPFTDMRNGAKHLCIPDDLGYPTTSEPLDTALRG